MQTSLPLPPFFDPDSLDRVWRVPYEERANAAHAWAARHAITPAAQDSFRVCLILVDVQNTFCVPGYELFVGGRSGAGAVDDNRRLCRFIYTNLGRITQIHPTLDTHQAMQIFHPLFWVDRAGNHPAPYTLISAQDVAGGRWRISPDAAASLGLHKDYVEQFVAHYTGELARRGKYDLTIWPYHAMLGGISHALVSGVEEAIFFHSVVRRSQPDFEIKGQHPLTEHYSAVGPEVLTDARGEPIAAKSDKFLSVLQAFDAVVIAGQAKSHCVAWTVEDILAGAQGVDPALARKVYLLEDCTSPVVIPGVIDYSEQADAAFQRFAKAGMHIVRSVDPMPTWPDFPA